MALRVWLPLNGNLENKGISGVVPTLMGSGITYGNGKIGQAATFPNNCNSCIHMPGFKLQTGSWCAWIKVLGEGSGTSQRILSEGRDTGSIGTNIWVTKDGATLYCTSHKKQLQATVGTGVWFHIALTFGDGKMTLYKNGTIWSSISYTEDSDYAQSSDRFVLGKMSYSYTNTSNYFPFNGQLNDVRIYDHCLSAKEVKEISQGLILHYKLDGFSGGIGDNILTGTATQTTVLASGTGMRANGTWSQASGGNGVHAVINIENDTPVPGVNWGFQITNNTSGNRDFAQRDQPYKNGVTYTVSWYMRGTGKYLVRQWNTTDGKQMQSKTGSVNTAEWTYYTWTFTATEELETDECTLHLGATGNTSLLEWCAIKMEIGSVATPWTPAPEDLGIDITKIIDSSGYGNNGITLGAVTTEANELDGRYSISGKFNENADSVTISPCFSVGQTQTEMTTSIWAKTNTLNSTAPNLMSLGENSFWRFRLASASSVWWYIRVGSTQRSATYSISGKNLLDNNWHHYAVTFKNGIVVFYIDGVQIGTTNCSDSATYITCNNAGNTWHLAGYSATSESFIGNLADARIYATALSAEDVLDLYHTPANIDNLGGIHGFEFIENDKNSIYKNGIIEHDLYSEPIQLEDGSLWVPICVHNINGGNNMFATTDDFSIPVYHSHDLWANFPNIDLISRPENGYYEFLVKQQIEIDGAWSTYRFKQTVNPLTATWATAGPNSGNFTWISGYNGTAYGGMYKMSSPTATSGNYMCFTNSSSGNWFGCGCKQVYQGGIPSICNTKPKGWQLVYMRTDKYLYKNYKNGITEATNFIEK